MEKLLGMLNGVTTAMKFRTIRRHVKESLKSLSRNGWMSFASISAVTVTLLLVGVFFVIMMNLNSVATSIEKDVVIRVHIDTATTEQEQQLLRKKIEQIPEVDSIDFSPKSDELEQLIASFGEEGEAYKLIEQDNPLRDVFIVKTKEPQDTMEVSKKIEKFDYVYKANYGQGEVEKIFQVTSLSRNVGIGLIIGLLFTAMFLISNTIRITIFARHNEIEIMRLVGATNAFIRWPFFLEGLWIGILGAVIPIIAISTTYYYVVDYLQSKLEGHFIQVLDYTPFIYQVSGLLILLGAIIGVWGSFISVRKFLRA